MCGGCGSPPPSANWYDAGVENSARGRAQALLRLATAAERVFGNKGIKVQAQPASRSLVLRGPTGRSEIVQQFAKIAPAAESLGGGQFNPLEELSAPSQSQTGHR